MTDTTARQAFDELRDQVHLVLAHLLTDGAMDCPPVTDEKRQALADVTQTRLDALLSALNAAMAKLAATERERDALRGAIDVLRSEWMRWGLTEVHIKVGVWDRFERTLESINAATQLDGGDV